MVLVVGAALSGCFGGGDGGNAAGAGGSGGGAGTGSGAACAYNGTAHADGESFPATDGCNTCFCADGNVGCTEIGCAPGVGGTGAGGGSGASGCDYGGQRYEVGDGFESTDGCNQCSCTEEGVACTKIACAPAGPGTCPDTSLFCESVCQGGASDDQGLPEGCPVPSCLCAGGCPDGTCDLGGVCYGVGQRFGQCNECSCLDGGQTVCTDEACPPTECPAEPPMSGAACQNAGAKCGYGDIRCTCQDPPGGGDGPRTWNCQLN